MIQDMWLVGARGYWVHSFLCSFPGTAKAEREAGACWHWGPGVSICWFNCIGDETAQLRQQLPWRRLTQRVGLWRRRTARSPRPWSTCVLLLPSLICFQFQLFYLWTLDSVLAAVGTIAATDGSSYQSNPSQRCRGETKGCCGAIVRYHISIKSLLFDSDVLQLL